MNFSPPLYVVLGGRYEHRHGLCLRRRHPLKSLVVSMCSGCLLSEIAAAVDVDVGGASLPSTMPWWT